MSTTPRRRTMMRRSAAACSASSASIRRSGLWSVYRPTRKLGYDIMPQSLLGSPKGRSRGFLGLVPSSTAPRPTKQRTQQQTSWSMNPGASASLHLLGTVQEVERLRRLFQGRHGCGDVAGGLRVAGRGPVAGIEESAPIPRLLLRGGFPVHR